jgi:HD-GYP domain-containing protein (c-di-GMP phosphodiesterase class II)
MQIIMDPLDISERFPQEIPVKDCFDSYVEMLRFRNPALYLHSQRVGIVAYLLALALGHPSKFADLLQYAGWVHDLGALFLPIRVHPHFLREELYFMPEWQKIYKLHPVVGAKILGKISSFNSSRENLCSIILHHHENWDGSGFPKGLREKEIPVGARILRVADALVRKIDSPPHGEGKSLKDALFEMLEDSKRIFDPKAISELIGIEDTIKVWLNLIEEESEQKVKESLLSLGDGLNEAVQENTYN